MRHSESFKSFEEKVGNAYENVKVNIVYFIQFSKLINFLSAFSLQKNYDY